MTREIRLAFAEFKVKQYGTEIFKFSLVWYFLEIMDGTEDRVPLASHHLFNFHKFKHLWLKVANLGINKEMENAIIYHQGLKYIKHRKMYETNMLL